MALLLLLPLPALALRAMSEQQLAGVTGQDGVSINLTLPKKATFNVSLYDRDGIPAQVFAHYKENGYAIAKTNTGAVAGAVGALEMDAVGIDVSQATAPIKLVLDAGQNSQGKALLNINVSLPAKASLHLGDIKLASVSSAPGSRWDTADKSTLLLSNGGAGYDLEIGGSSLNIQLGQVAQAMQIVPTIGSQNPNQAVAGRHFKPIFLTNFTLKQGVHISGLELKDAYKDSSGKQPNGLKIDDLYINNNVYDAVNDSYASLEDSQTADLSVKKLGASVTQQGLAFAIGQLGDAKGGIDVQMNGNHLGGSNSLGNLYIRGLHMGDSVLTIAGH